MKITDLTLPLYTGMSVYPGDPEVSIELIQTHTKEGWDMRRIQINGHDGTHVNAQIYILRNASQHKGWGRQSGTSIRRSCVNSYFFQFQKKRHTC